MKGFYAYETARRLGICSLETAKKLKDSGWSGMVKADYVVQGEVVGVQVMNQNWSCFEIDLDKPHEFYPAPTLEELGSSAVDEVAKRFIK